MEASWLTHITPPSSTFDSNLSDSALKIIAFLKKESGFEDLTSAQLNSCSPSYNTEEFVHISSQNRYHFPENHNCTSEYCALNENTLNIYDQPHYFKENVEGNQIAPGFDGTQLSSKSKEDYVNVDELFNEPMPNKNVHILDNFGQNSNYSLLASHNRKALCDLKDQINNNIPVSNYLDSSVDMFSQSDSSDAPRKPAFKRLFNYLPSKKLKAKQCHILHKSKKNKLKINSGNKITNYFQEIKNEKFMEKKILKSSENKENSNILINSQNLQNINERNEKKLYNSEENMTDLQEFTEREEIAMDHLNSPSIKLISSPPLWKSKKKLNFITYPKITSERNDPSSNIPERSKFNINTEDKQFYLHDLHANETVSEFKIIKYLADNDKIKEFYNELITEIGFTICYKEGFCSLNKPLQENKKIYPPNGIMIRFEFEDTTSKYLFIDTESLKLNKCRNFINFLLQYKCRKLCYEAQSFILLMLDFLELPDKRECYDWCILDPLLGIWLLDPDKTHISFAAIKETLAIIKVERNDDWMINVCQYLKEQSHSMELIYSQLVSKSLRELFIGIETKVIPIIADLDRFLINCHSNTLYISINMARINRLCKYVGLEKKTDIWKKREKPITQSMESWTIKIDKEKMIKMGDILNKKMKSLENQGMNLVGKQFQIRSSQQLRKILYEDLKLDQMINIPIKGTASTGVKSTAEPILKRLAKVHPLPQIILEYRHVQKLKSTYIEGILNHIWNKTFISTSWEQFSAATGRITSSSPNLQAIPKKTLEINGNGGLNIRSTFISREDHTFVSVDFQHIELRIFAHLSKDKRLIQAFHEENDIFTTITNLRLGTEISDSEERTKTKTTVYAHLYGAGINKIAEILSLEECVASDLTNQIHNIIPSLRNFRHEIIDKCKKQQFLVTIGGRQRLFRNINSPNPHIRTYSERQAVNFVIQGSAADICKVAMLNTERKLRNEQKQCKLLLQIHDELVWEVADNHVKEVVDLVKNLLESEASWPENIKLIVPLKVKVTQGKNWGEMSCQ